MDLIEQIYKVFLILRKITIIQKNSLNLKIVVSFLCRGSVNLPEEFIYGVDASVTILNLVLLEREKFGDYKKERTNIAE